MATEDKSNSSSGVSYPSVPTGQRDIKSATIRKQQKIIDSNPLVSGLIHLEDTNTEPVFNSGKAKPEAEKVEQQLSESQKVRNTLADAVSKFREDLRKDGATSVSLIRPLHESISSIKPQSSETIEIGLTEAGNMISGFEFKAEEVAKLEKLGLPTLAKDLEALRTSIGINDSYRQGGKKDIEFIQAFAEKYIPVVAQAQAAEQAQLAEIARIREQQEAERKAINDKSNEDYSKIADERIAFYAAQKSAEETAAKEAEAAKQEAETKKTTEPAVEAKPEAETSAKADVRFVPLPANETEYKPDLAFINLDKNNIPTLPASITGQMTITGPDGKSEPNPQMRKDKIMDETFTWMDSSLTYIDSNPHQYSEDEKFVAREQVISQYASIFDQYKYPDDKLLDASDFNHIGRRPHEALERLKPEVARINEAKASEVQVAAATPVVEPTPAVEAPAATPSALQTLASLKDLANTPDLTPIGEQSVEQSSTARETLAVLNDIAAAPTPEKTPEVTPATTPKAEANPEALAAMVDTAKSLATRGIDMAKEKVQHQYERAKGLVSVAGQLADLHAARNELDAERQLADNQAEPKVPAVEAPVEPALTRSFVPTAPVENPAPIAETAEPAPQPAPEVAATEAEVAPKAEPTAEEIEAARIAEQIKALSPEEQQTIANLKDSDDIPRAIVVEEDEITADEGVLPGIDEVPVAHTEPAVRSLGPDKADKEKPAETKITIQSGELPKELAKLLDGKDWNDTPVITYLQGKGADIELPKGRPLIVTSSASAELGQAYVKFKNQGGTDAEFVTLSGEILQKGIVVDRAGKIDDVKPDASLNPTQIAKDLNSIAKAESLAKN